MATPAPGVSPPPPPAIASKSSKRETGIGIFVSGYICIFWFKFPVVVIMYEMFTQIIFFFISLFLGVKPPG